MSLVSPWFSLGYVIPHLYTDMDAYQFYRVAPDGMMLVTTGLNLKEYSLAAVETELPALWAAFDRLKGKKVDRIALSGVPVASVLGRKKMREILDEGAQRTGIACDTDLEAHIATLQHFNVTKLALATRWPEHVNTALSNYLKQAGIDVVSLRAQGRNLDQNKISSPLADHELALELGRAALAAAPEAQALLLPGGLWFAIHAVPILEAEFGVPVLTNIASTTWAALAAAPRPLAQRPDPRWGRLLANV